MEFLLVNKSRISQWEEEAAAGNGERGLFSNAAVFIAASIPF